MVAQHTRRHQAVLSAAEILRELREDLAEVDKNLLNR